MSYAFYFDLQGEVRAMKRNNSQNQRMAAGFLTVLLLSLFGSRQGFPQFSSCSLSLPSLAGKERWDGARVKPHSAAGGTIFPVESTGSHPNVARPHVGSETMAKIFAAMKMRYPSLDFGPDPMDNHFAQGGQATVFIPKGAKHVLRVTRINDPTKVEEKEREDRALFTDLNHNPLRQGLALPLRSGTYHFPNERGTFMVQAFSKYDGSLSDFYKSDAYRKLNFSQKMKMAQQLIQTIGNLHAAGYFHFDLKSENILYKIAPDGEVKLAIGDLGLTTKPEALENSQHIRGTAFYVSPTALSFKWLDERNDLYPLGVVIQELMTGETVRDVAESEQATPKSKALANISESLIQNWLENGRTAHGFQFHTSGKGVFPTQTRAAFPYAPVLELPIEPAERAARANLAVLGWFPFRTVQEMGLVSQEALRNPEGFEKWFVKEIFKNPASEKSSFNWTLNGDHIVQSILSNDVLAKWVMDNVSEIGLSSRANLIHSLTQINEAVHSVQLLPSGEEVRTERFRVVTKASPGNLDQLSLHLTQQEAAFEMWFGRFINGHMLEKLLAKLSPPLPDPEK